MVPVAVGWFGVRCQAEIMMCGEGNGDVAGECRTQKKCPLHVCVQKLPTELLLRTTDRK